MKYFLVFILLLQSFFLFAQKQGQPLIDSLLKDLSTSLKEDTNRVKLLNDLSFTYSTIDPDEGIKLAQEALALSQRLNWEEGTGAAENDLGVNHEAKSEHSKALDYDLKALAIFKQLGRKNSMAGALTNIAVVYDALCNYPQALENDFKALSIYEEVNNKNGSAIILENIGTLYFEQKVYSKTREYYTKSLKIYKDIGNKEGMARNMGNMGMMLDANGDYAKALEYHLMALKINQELGSKNLIQINASNIGNVYDHLKDYPKALEYQFRSLKLSEELGNKSGIAIDSGNLGETYFHIATDSTIKLNSSLQKQRAANLKLAINYLEKAINICRQINYSAPLIEFSQYLSNAYSLSGNYKKAFENLKLYSVTKDSVFSLENKIQIGNLEAKRGDELKNKESLIKKEEIQINKLNLSKKHDEQIIYMICIVLLLLVIILVLKSLHTYRRSNRTLLKEKKKHLLLIEAQIDRIKKQTSVLEEISHMQAHDVRGPVATILGLVQIFNFENLSDPINKTAIEGIASITEKLDTAVKEVIRKENSLNDTQ